MENKNFCHLHLHNEYSVLDGFGKAENYVKAAKEKGFKYLALTNHGNTDGLLDFQEKCIEYGIKPVMGCELYICKNALQKSKETRGYNHITALIKNEKGWRNLNQLLTFGHTIGFYHRPRISFSEILDHAEGLIFLSGCAATALMHQDGQNFIRDLSSKTEVYLEIMPHDIPEQLDLNNKIFKLAINRWADKVVATNDCHYIEPEDYKSQDILLCIQTHKKVNDKDRWKFGIKGLHLRTANEMFKAFKKQGVFGPTDIKAAMRRTVRIARKCCDFRIKQREIKLPNPPIKQLEEINEDKFLWRLCTRGHKKIFGCSIKENPKYHKRLKEEFKIVKHKKFSRYFLVVWELVNWCKSNDIMVGPGRGSVGGSLLAFLMGITSVDPIKFNLLFSRFIDEERIDYPDIDIDFEDRKRDLVINHLQDIYGEDHVAGVTAFSRMQARNALRDVARAYSVPYGDVDEVAKLIVESISDVLKEEETARRFKEKYPDVIKHAIKLEGQVRGYSQHAAAIIISQEKLTNGARCYLADRKAGRVINWEKDNAEYLGLIKLDILGLNTLTILNETKRLVKENYKTDLVFENIKLNDKNLFEMISAGNTIGCFQIGTPAMTNLIKEMGVEKFEHISDAVALVRPGPKNSGMTDQYVERKFGKSWKKHNKIYEQITKDTYGNIVYQEQVMAVINKVAGLPYSTADKIRKIIGKKRDVKEFEQYKEKFIKGCLHKKTMTKSEALEFWEALEKHASYSFNKSHSVEYALIAYWTAYCKYYYPTEFICASLSYLATSKEEQKNELVEEARRLGLTVVLPKIGISDPIRWVAKDGVKLFVPFIEAKGIGEKTALKLKKVKQPKQKKFFSVNEEKKVAVNKKVEQILQDIDAYNSQDLKIPKEAAKYFTFDLTTDPYYNYPNLINLLNSKDGVIDKYTGKAGFNWIRIDLDHFIKGMVYIPGIIKKRRYRNKALLRCKRCDLIKECTAPVLPSKGKYNIMVLGEAPGPDEDEQGKGFVGRVSVLLWKIMKKYKLKRSYFHITNTVKCYPKRTRTPKKIHVQTCAEKWLKQELKKLDCRIVLAMGNVAAQFFRGKGEGITRLNGSTEWNEQYSCWVCWCVHPSYAVRNPENEPDFDTGIKNFKCTLETFMKGEM